MSDQNYQEKMRSFVGLCVECADARQREAAAYLEGTRKAQVAIHQALHATRDFREGFRLAVEDLAEEAGERRDRSLDLDDMELKEVEGEYYTYVDCLDHLRTA